MTIDLTAGSPILTPLPYLPRVSWFVTLLSNSNINWHTNELYDKRHPRNRCKIATAHGAQQLSVPLVNGRSQRLPLNQIQPLYDGKWQREHIHAMQTAYGRTPYFLYYADALFDIINVKHESLATLNLTLIHLLLKNFGIVINETSNTATSPFEQSADYLFNEKQLSDDFQYPQAFSGRTGFIKDCSGIDLLFNHGPDSIIQLTKATRA